MKNGEEEAKQILERKGYLFDNTYFDDNSKNSMPDLRLSDGRYLEVTHTLHNNEIYSKPNKFQMKNTTEKMKIIMNAKEAHRRIKKNYYCENKIDDDLEQFEKDKKIVRSHFGRDVCDFTKHSEFKCDIPEIKHSVDNIIHKIEEKSAKHPNGDTDLFIFITKGEYDSFCYLIEPHSFNGCFRGFANVIISSSFDNIFLCVWNFESQQYAIDDPILLKISDYNDGIVLDYI